jgi:N-acetylneuraminic acid mutarotase
MSKSFALVLVLVFLTASFVIVAKPISGASTTGDSWVSKAPMPSARANLGVAVVDGTIYAIGGDAGPDVANCDTGTSMTYEVVNSTEAYDPSSNSWISKAPMPTARALFGTAFYQNKIYCIGGYNGGTIFIGPETWNWKTEYYDVGANEVYDSATNTWATKASMPTPKYSAATDIVNGEIYVIGGYTMENLGTTDNITQVYDPQTDLWTTKSSAPLPVASSASAVVDNKIYIVGEKSAGQNVMEIYDPTNDSWSIGKATPTGYWATAAATSGMNALKRIYFFDENRTDIYDPAADNWATGTPAPTDRLIAKVAIVNDTFYLIGGRTGQWGYITMEYPTTLNEQYTPVGYGTPDPSYLLETTPPKISVQSLLNQTYNESSVPLVFTIDKPVNWVGYSLDGEQNVTVTGNCTVANMTNGLHTITVYANDTFGNVGASETITFNVAKPEPFPTATVAAVSGASAVVVVVAGLFIYFKKRKC